MGVKRNGPAEFAPPGARTAKGYFMATTSLPKEKARRMERILAEAIERHARELMGIEERLILEERIRRLRKKLAA